MRTDAMEKRIRKLEIGRLPTPRYVVALSPEEFELPDPKRRKLIALRSGGRPVAAAKGWRCLGDLHGPFPADRRPLGHDHGGLGRAQVRRGRYPCA